jgi:hypothetical protein
MGSHLTHCRSHNFTVQGSSRCVRAWIANLPADDGSKVDRCNLGDFPGSVFIWNQNSVISCSSTYVVPLIAFTQPSTTRRVPQHPRIPGLRSQERPTHPQFLLRPFVDEQPDNNVDQKMQVQLAVARIPPGRSPARDRGAR